MDFTQDLDKNIRDFLKYQKTNLHTIDSFENLTLENSMDNSNSTKLSSQSTIDVPGQTKSKISPNGLINDLNSKLIIVMVGLPARGKSYLTKKLTRYLNWLQYNTKIFNVGNTRRLSKKNHGPANEPFAGDPHDANFFDPKNSSTLQIREQWAMDTLDQLLKYLMYEDGTVGIFDATNTTKTRRRHIIETIRNKTPDDTKVKILFLESVCTDHRIINRNIKLKLSGPDYKDKDPVESLKDFRSRLNNYEKVYETIDENEEDYYDEIDETLQYIKIINAGKKIISYNISGFLSSQVIFFMLNFNLNERQIWIARHGQTYDNLNGVLGCSKNNGKLTPLGEKYSKALAKFMYEKKKEFRFRQLLKGTIEAMEEQNEENLESDKDEAKDGKHKIKVDKELHFSVWSSMLRPTIQTASFFNDQNFNIKQLKMLNELSHGKVNGYTLKKFATKYPNDFKKYQEIFNSNDVEDISASNGRKKLLYRFPGGESYLDVINRLRPIIVELERMEDHVLLVTHKVVARVLLSYFMNLDKEYITELDVPLHSVYVLEPKPYGVDWNCYHYNEELDWFEPINKDRILRKKKKREVLSNDLIHYYSHVEKNNKKKTSFYFDSPPSEPITPRVEKKPSFSGIVFEKEKPSPDGEQAFESTDKHVDSGSESDSESDNDEEDDNNEHWYYQLDNQIDPEDYENAANDIDIEKHHESVVQLASNPSTTTNTTTSNSETSLQSSISSQGSLGVTKII